MEPLEVIEGRHLLGFAGIASPSLYMIPREQQFAEKLHAYTLPRQGAANTRIRDLVDMVLLIQSATLARNKVTEAIRVTFERRETHALPNVLPNASRRLEEAIRCAGQRVRFAGRQSTTLLQSWISM